MADTLKSTCEQCIHLSQPRLEFIPQNLQREREIIQRDLNELVSAATLGNEKTVVILAGTLFESVLFLFIQAQSTNIADRRGSFTFDPEHSLDNFVRIFNRWFGHLLILPDAIIDYRNIVHINHELQQPVDICRGAAAEMLRFLDALLASLPDYV